MTDTKAHGLLGLCVRAGQASFGEDGCLGAIRGGKCGLLILDGGASDNARKRYTDAMPRRKTRIAPTGMASVMPVF